jgi:mannose-6-phosphate isomerase
MKPIRLQPIYQQRVWGGRELETQFKRTLPADGKPYGEAWEVVDRPEAQSIVADGEWAGKSLHELWYSHRAEIFGATAPQTERFPLLLKILDARDDLSIQVHPPAALAESLQGEPKTEMWFIADATEDGSLCVGVKPGVNQISFAQALEAGTVADCVHRIPVVADDYIFIPSGRLHAIGGGLVIFEIQQNSDTTYRVFDWNRVGLDGKPRELHVAESLQCIDFTDTQPVVSAASLGELVKCDYFQTSFAKLGAGESQTIGNETEFLILAVVKGRGIIGGTTVLAGDHLLIPASASTSDRTLSATDALSYLEVRFV